MIKDTNAFTHGGTVSECYCDSCHTKIFSCSEFQWEKGQQLVYSSILCESCGQKHNKDVGDDVKKIQKLETKLKWTNEKLQEVRDFLEGRVNKLEIRKEELLKRLQVL
ncbi:MAG: hypothetical protein R2685_10960 [Candidatus Nitrosocosmicus sp.]|nr:hypothetical protein [Candidatus Nitrosocosmicus sp.]